MAKNKKIKIEKFSEKYDLRIGEFNIVVEIFNERINIMNVYREKEFVFKGSEPEVVEAIGRLLIKASELVKK